MKSARFAITVAVLTVLSTAAWADLHDPSNSADYLIVTTQGLISANPWIGNLAAWRTAHSRVAMVVPVENVWNEFGSGSPSDTVLKEFLHYARRHWQAPQLRDVFIIGSRDVVPWHMEPDSEQHGYPPDSIWWERLDFLSDFFYTTEPESSNFIPVLSVGRLPWSPASGVPLWNYYDKVTAYENASGDWQARVHLVADSSFIGFLFAEMVESRLVPHVHPGYTIERDYLACPPGDPFHGDRDEVLANLNAGSYLMAYLGHYDSARWSPDSMRIDSADLAALTNGYRLPIVVGMGTYSRSLLSFMPIPSALLGNPQGGAIGYVGNTTVTWAIAGTLFRAQLIGLATSDSVATLGDIWRMTELEFVSVYARDLNYPGSSPRQTALGTALFGDPGLRLPPRPSSVPQVHSPTAERFQIAGCYPNPFNATTRVEFDLPHQTHVALRVYDVTGRLATTLVDEVRAAGRHTVVWDGTGLGSGVYFAVLESPSSRAVHKVVLLK